MDGKKDQTSRSQLGEKRRQAASAKFEGRRNELAQAALRTLGQVGYANASLREIAQESDYSHGVFHYYFDDRDDLIACAMLKYKSECATRYDEIVDTAPDQPGLIAGFSAKLRETLIEDSDMHRLWYDLRAQALFNTALQAEVRAIDRMLEDMIWRIMSRYFAMEGRTPGVTSELAYALFDGLFQRMLLSWLTDGAALPVDRLTLVVADTVQRLR